MYLDKEGDIKPSSVILTIIVILLFLASLFTIFPVYRVWQREMSGKATLREAEWDRKVQIEEAEANLQSEVLNAKAEVERAKGMAEAIKVEGGQLTTEYIQYLWVRQNTFNDKTTIYIPTEANLPILEANPNK